MATRSPIQSPSPSDAGEIERHNARCFTLLRSLGQAVPIGVIGSAALLLDHPAARSRYRLPDLDVVLRERDVPSFDAWVRGNGAETTVWGAPWTPDLELAGKFYVRAMVSAIQLDAAFELSRLSVADFLASVRDVEGIPVCAEALVRELKRGKDEAAYARFLEQTGLPQR